jgi:hypothetical protein
MTVKAASTRIPAKVAGKSVRATNADPRAKRMRLSRLETKRLEQFKALMDRNAGKCSFAGYDG